MIGTFATMMIEGLIAPRRSARYMIDRQLDLREIGLLIVLSYVMNSILMILLPPLSDSEPQGVLHLFGLIFWAIFVLFLSWVAWWPGRMFGGRGSWGQAVSAIAWMSVVSVIVLPLWLIGIQQVPVKEILEAMSTEDLEKINAVRDAITPGARATFLALANISAIIWLWIYASFIAEIHGFRTWVVVASIIGFNLVLGFLF